MYLNTITVLRTFLACCITFKDVFSNRLASPQRLFSEEPDIFDGSYYLSQSDHRRFSRSIDERQGMHERIRRNTDGSSRPPRPKITGPAALCSHDELYIRWTDTNLVSEKGAIFALCRPNPSRSITSVIYVSYDYGISWVNLTPKFSKILKKEPSVNMYYFVPNAPKFIVFADTLNKRIFYTNDEGRNIDISQYSSPFSPQFAPENVYINPEKSSMVLASEKVTRPKEKDIYKLYISKNGARSFNHLQLFVDVKAFYWGSKKYGDKSTDLFLEAKTNAHGLQGYQLDCSNTSETSNCTLVKILTNVAPINGEITDFLVKGDYMFVTQHNEAKTGLYLYVKYKRTGKFVKANIVTPTPVKEAFVYDVSDGQVMLVCNLRKNETNLYISYDATGETTRCLYQEFYITIQIQKFLRIG
ncbi:sortilin-related receptor-like [Xenia sp. Carnegie-2017]|uniref:sortilin-related receptor-like n=1 Tax=Xenia sp. Carnegie-2017 TaxID=2897299 RepID=UPI001F04A524|nr:sortilin-related receptor-like [Xenia sp. Carnegie-2017]